MDDLLEVSSIIKTSDLLKVSPSCGLGQVSELTSLTSWRVSVDELASKWDELEELTSGTS